MKNLFQKLFIRETSNTAIQFFRSIFVGGQLGQSYSALLSVLPSIISFRLSGFLQRLKSKTVQRILSVLPLSALSVWDLLNLLLPPLRNTIFFNRQDFLSKMPCSALLFPLTSTILSANALLSYSCICGTSLQENSFSTEKAKLNKKVSNFFFADFHFFIVKILDL